MVGNKIDVGNAIVGYGDNRQKELKNSKPEQPQTEVGVVDRDSTSKNEKKLYDAKTFLHLVELLKQYLFDPKKLKDEIEITKNKLSDQRPTEEGIAKFYDQFQERLNTYSTTEEQQDYIQAYNLFLQILEAQKELGDEKSRLEEIVKSEKILLVAGAGGFKGTEISGVIQTQNPTTNVKLTIPYQGKKLEGLLKMGLDYAIKTEDNEFEQKTVLGNGKQEGESIRFVPTNEIYGGIISGVDGIYPLALYIIKKGGD